MNIVFIHPSAEIGGAARSLLDTMEGLSARGMSCRLIVPAQGPLPERSASLGIETVIIPFPLWLGPWLPRMQRLRVLGDHLRAGWSLARSLRKWKPDLVYTNSLLAGAGGLAAWLAGLPHVWHVREFGPEDHGLSFLLGRTWTYRLVNRWGLGCLVNSGAVGHVLRSWMPERKIAVVHQGVRPPVARHAEKVPPRTTACRVVLLGSVHEGKRQLDAVEAVSRLIAAGVDIELLIAGGGGDEGYYQTVERTVAESGQGSRIRMLGNIDYGFALLESADIVLMCSQQEAFGRVTVEAMLAGKPVIGTNAGGTREIVEDGVTGLLYPPGDVDALTRHIKELADHPDRREEMGRNGHTRAEELFSVSGYVSRLAGHIEEWVSGKVHEVPRSVLTTP